VTDRVVVIVGGSSGIGRASAERLAAHGDRLVLAARHAEGLERAADACRSAGAADVRTMVIDVGEAADVARLVDDTRAEFGRIDALVHTATVMAYGTIEELPQDVFEEVVDTAIHGTAHLARAMLPVFREQRHGTFVIVNSLLGSITVPNMGAYSTAKWGQRAVARTLQQEVAGEKDIHVCIVSPGSLNTPIYYQAANYTGRGSRPPIPVLQPERAATEVVKLLDRPQQHVSLPVGPLNPVIITGFRLLPFVYDRIVGPLFRLGAQTSQAEPNHPGNVHKPDPSGDRIFGHWPDRSR
jgi:NAD(P)-dependent dehydrogenase (short-subunit alcohol dehydrogenase family)